MNETESYVANVDAQVATVHVSGWIYDHRVQPGETQVFVVGDVHGYAEQLDALLWAMLIKGDSFAKTHLVLLGDIIDKGPDPAGAISVVARWCDAHAAFSSGKPGFKRGAFERDTLLLGNHDLFYHAAATGDEKSLRLWKQNGGQGLLDQIGATTCDEIRSRLAARVGLAAVAIYESGVSHLEIGNLLFVHAGISPTMPLADVFSQDRMAWLEGRAGRQKHWAWIRNEFLIHEGEFVPLEEIRGSSRLVVHGHTAEALVQLGKGRGLNEPLHQIDGWRLGLDGTRGPNPSIAGAEIRDGQYRIFTVPIPQEVLLDPSHAWRQTTAWLL